MALTAGNVSIPETGDPVLIFETPEGVPTDVVVSANDGFWLLNSTSQTATDGFFLNGGPISITGLVGAIYGAGADAVDCVASFVASNIA